MIFGSQFLDLITYSQLLMITYTGIFLLAISMYQSTALQFMRELYNHHRLAYNSHIKSLAGLFLATELTLLFLLSLEAVKYIDIYCYSINQEYDIPLTDSICSYLVHSDKSDTLAAQEFLSLLFGVMNTLPMLSFFWLDSPHDCYTCLGKDPDRIYSQFQLSLEERAKRALRAKLNKKQQKEIVSQPEFLQSLFRDENWSKRQQSSIKLINKARLQLLRIDSDQMPMDELVHRFAGTEVSITDSLYQSFD